jgi:hypothetical protein
MFRVVERISEPGEYQLAKNPNTLRVIEPGVFICTNRGSMPFKGEWALVNYLRESLSFESNRGYFYGRGIYETRPPAKIGLGDNFLIVNGLPYCLYYSCNTNTNSDPDNEGVSTSRISKNRILDIEGFKEEPTAPIITKSEDRGGFVEFVFKTYTSRGGLRAWGVWILDESQNPSSLVLKSHEWPKVASLEHNLPIWKK